MILKIRNSNLIFIRILTYLLIKKKLALQNYLKNDQKFIIIIQSFIIC